MYAHYSKTNKNMKFYVMRLRAHDSCHVAVLQCVAVCCSVLQYVAVCYSVLHCVEACMTQATLNQVSCYAANSCAASADNDDCFYFHFCRNNVVIAFGTLSSLCQCLITSTRLGTTAAVSSFHQT